MADLIRSSLRNNLSILSILLTLLSISGEKFEYSYSTQPIEDEDSKTVRQKRVLYGTPLLDRNSYEVRKYYVFINMGWYSAMNEGYQCDLNEKNVYLGSQTNECRDLPVLEGSSGCGGALIAEYVVETACHCIAESRGGIDWQHDFSLFYPLRVFENHFRLYLGYADYADMRRSTGPLMFIPHQNCHMFMRRVSSDYGLIFTREALIHSPKFVGPAPLYAESELNRIYDEIQKKERVCLSVGFGPTGLIKNESEDRYLYGPTSDLLMHTWNRVLPYYECKVTFMRLDTNLKSFHPYKLLYNEFATWLCMKQFGKFTGISAQGDSGSPVTCDSLFIGMVSAGGVLRWNDYDANFPSDEKGFSKWRSVIGSLKFAILENAAEYRRSLLLQLAELAQQYAVGVPGWFEEWGPKPVPTGELDGLSRGNIIYIINPLWIMIHILIFWLNIL